MKQEKEIQVVTLMIEKYCRKKHKTKGHELCKDCAELLDYVKLRRGKCPFGDNKPFCSNCRIHCYQQEMRDKIKEVMRFSGPRMITSHPILTVSHVIQTQKQRKKLKKEEKQK